MTELVEITERDGEPLVDARKLHHFLVVESESNNVGQQFNHWIKAMLEDDFEEFTDYTIVCYNYAMAEISQSDNQRVSKRDYFLTLDCAKQIAMLQRNDRGREARKYFIECERKLKEYIESLTPAEQFLRQAQINVNIERKQKAMERKQKALEQRQDEADKERQEDRERLDNVNDRVENLEITTTHRPDYFTVAGYARFINSYVTTSKAKEVGKKAATLCRERGIPIDFVKDGRFGKVNMYPAKILEEVF